MVFLPQAAEDLGAEAPKSNPRTQHPKTQSLSLTEFSVPCFLEASAPLALPAACIGASRMTTPATTTITTSQYY